jgi:hypothetical protein
MGALVGDAGWYPDPEGRKVRRYFDGTDWTDHWERLDEHRRHQILQDTLVAHVNSRVTREGHTARREPDRSCRRLTYYSGRHQHPHGGGAKSCYRPNMPTDQVCSSCGGPLERTSTPRAKNVPDDVFVRCTNEDCPRERVGWVTPKLA